MAIAPVETTLDIVLPVKNRDTVIAVITALVRELKLVQNVSLGQIWVCDGGSTEADCLRQLRIVEQWRSVQVLRCAQSGFNKGWLLNQGIQATAAAVVLISDIDIVWKADALRAIALAAAAYPNRIYSVLSVKETHPNSVAVRRQRYTYRIEKQGENALVRVCTASPLSSSLKDQRPGCGIVCAQRQAFEQIGGYKTCFVGWGWEDQDLLIRAQLLGYEVSTLGEVTHLSHGDEQRSAVDASVEVSRNRNIVRCLTALSQHRLLGDLTERCPAADNSIISGSISVQYPIELES